MPSAIRIGTAGWSVSGRFAEQFPGEGTHLQRYARRLPAVEINSSFYRPHRPETYARWAAGAPPDFRFAVKTPREITHQRKLIDAAAPLDGFLAAARELGDKLGSLLVQLPPSLFYDEAVAVPFFELLRARFDGHVVCEPRHRSWFADEVDAMLARLCVARVAADPAPAPRAQTPGGWPGLAYHRLHGAPEMYRSGYAAAAIADLAQRLRAAGDGVEVWCIFDNTALGEALADALSLDALLHSR